MDQMGAESFFGGQCGDRGGYNYLEDHTEPLNTR